jgi:hypothetical protein
MHDERKKDRREYRKTNAYYRPANLPTMFLAATRLHLHITTYHTTLSMLYTQYMQSITMGSITHLTATNANDLDYSSTKTGP